MTAIVEHPDDSHSTEAATVEGSVWEVVFQTDEVYWHVAAFTDKALALGLAERGNSFLDPVDITKRLTGFQLREQEIVTALHREWSRQDFIDEIEGWEVGDWFLPEIEPEEAT